MKLVVDVNLTELILSPLFGKCNTLELLLSKSPLTELKMPLEAKVCLDFGLKQKSDFPIAAIAGNVDRINTNDHYWLRCDPVHLVVQRDTYTLSAPVPLKLKPQESELIIASLNAHFDADGLVFEVGTSGNWYVGVKSKSGKFPAMATSMPHEALQKNVQHFFPKGEDASQWMAIQNEIQMLLFAHEVNEVREADGLVAVNSVWLSGGGVLPSVGEHSAPQEYIVIGDTPFYEGLARYSNMNFAKTRTVEATSAFASLVNMANQDIRLSLPQDEYLEDWFILFEDFLRRRKIKQLVLNIGWYEKTFTTRLRTRDLYQFWRKQQSLSDLLK